VLKLFSGQALIAKYLIPSWPLWLHETIHFSLCTLSAFLVWRCFAKKQIRFWKLWATALLSGFFLDGDHLFDHFFAYGVRGFLNHGVLSFFDASIANPFLETGKVYVLFHGWEYLIIGIIILSIFWNKLSLLRYIFLAAFLSYFFHLCFDQLSWSHSGWGYFLTYRILTSFSLLKF